MPAQLVALNDGPNILLDKPILLVGRHQECDIQIESRKISRRHCCIAQVNDYLVVRDLDSTNGIRINGERVVEGKLKTGDELTIGSHRYQLSDNDGVAVPRSGGARQRPVEADDALLESCDHPVPILEPGKPAAPRVPRAPALPPPRLPRTPPRSASGPAPKADEDPLIIPDQLELMPRSGACIDLSKQPPPA